MLKTALLGLGLFWYAPATLFASVTSYADQFEYPVPQSVLAALAAEQAKLPSLAETLTLLQEEQAGIPSLTETLKLLQEEQSKIPPLAEVLQRLADETRALPPLGFVFTDERLVKLADAPEPQTWVLAALGLAAVGVRRKQKSPPVNEVVSRLEHQAFRGIQWASSRLARA